MQKVSEKVNLLLVIVDSEALDVFNTFWFTQRKKTNNENTLHIFEEYYTPYKNKIYKQDIFFNRVQEEGENMEEPATAPKKIQELQWTMSLFKCQHGVHNMDKQVDNNNIN